MSTIGAFVKRMVCPHTLEKGWPVDGDDAWAHTNCDCEKVEAPEAQPTSPADAPTY